MIEWFDPEEALNAQAKFYAEELVNRIRKGGPWAIEFVKDLVGYLGCLWQAKVNAGQGEAAQGIRDFIVDLKEVARLATADKRRLKEGGE